MNTFLTRDGRSFIIRRPIERDAENIINYSKILFASTDQLLTTLEEYAITIENEEIWINNFTETPDALCLVAELNDLLVGLLFFMPLTKKKNTHVGEFGVNVHPDLQGNGIGRVLVVELLKWAKENKRIEKIFSECVCHQSEGH